MTPVRLRTSSGLLVKEMHCVFLLLALLLKKKSFGASIWILNIWDSTYWQPQYIPRKNCTAASQIVHHTSSQCHGSRIWITDTGLFYQLPTTTQMTSNIVGEELVLSTLLQSFLRIHQESGGIYISISPHCLPAMFPLRSITNVVHIRYIICSYTATGTIVSYKYCFSSSLTYLPASQQWVEKWRIRALSNQSMSAQLNNEKPLRDITKNYFLQDCTHGLQRRKFQLSN